ncbi:MAG: TonB-dependent receptor [Betaproteobacteria bacterium]|nr:TonB-dependent receptor [Betaproteobacteria bacterium]
MRAARVLRSVLPLGAAAVLHARAHGAEVPPVPASSAAAVVQLPTVTIGAGSGTEGFRSPPQHAYTVDADTLGRQPATALADVLAQHLPGVALTHEQGNALQPTLHFNGFAASPLLGTPQGLSVFQDGVRVNEPFGDVVNWDLIPTEALRSIHLVPITDPVFGLNTLGGAVLLRTRDGRSAPGGAVGVDFGSFGRTTEHARYGSHAGAWSAFFAVRNQHDSGFVPYTASSSRNLFAKLTRRDAGNDFDLSYTFAQSRLAGSQTLPLEWMNTPTAVYTAPDHIDNQLNFLNLGDTQVLGAHWQLAARLSLRNSDQSGFNSNVNGNYDGSPPTLANPVATNVQNALHQQSRGLNLALHNTSPLAGRPNSASLGLSAEAQQVQYTQLQQPATFNAQRYTLGTGAFDQAPLDLGVRNHDTGLYLSDRLAAAPWLDVAAGARYERARVDLSDHLGGALGGHHSYSRLNPSVGLDLHPTPKASYYLRYAQGMRVPMAVELTCASPAAPCTLPNVLVADPELQPVIARTAQAGAVWRLGALRVHAEYTHTRLSNAIEFVSLANMTQGYFTNIPQELLRTLTLDLTTGSERWLWSASISRTLATYESAFLQPSPSNSSADPNGTIQIQPGDRLPNIPKWSLTLQTQFQPNERLLLHATVLAYSARYAQGDENNQDRHGTVPGYALVNLGAQYNLDPHWRLDLSVHNLFNRVYTDFGQLGVNEFTAANRTFSPDPASWQNTQFVAPGAPRGLWLGLRYAWS